MTSCFRNQFVAQSPIAVHARSALSFLLQYHQYCVCTQFCESTTWAGLRREAVPSVLPKTSQRSCHQPDGLDGTEKSPRFTPMPAEWSCP